MAAQWFKVSAEQNNVSSQFQLGKLYLEGLGVECDPQEASIWIKNSANNGHSGVHYLIGALYARGEIGVEKDFKQAIFFLKDDFT